MTVAPHRSLLIVKDAAAIAETAARRIVARLGSTTGRLSICLTGGSTPTALYRLLGTPPFRDTIPWDRVHWFMGDDRFVPFDDANSNMGLARRTFLDANAPKTNVHLIVTDAASPDIAARLYEISLRSFYDRHDIDPATPLFDIVLMGIGPDGHTASLFPDSSALDERERWVVGVETAPVAPHVSRVTLTLPTLASCREMLFLISGPEKREIVTRVLADATLPAARAFSQRDTVWLMDEAAAPDVRHDA